MTNRIWLGVPSDLTLAVSAFYVAAKRAKV